MTDYESLAKSSQVKLESLKIQKAQVQEKIKTLAGQLDLDPEQDLVPQIEELKKSLETKMTDLTKQLDEVAEEIKKLEA